VRGLNAAAAAMVDSLQKESAKQISHSTVTVLPPFHCAYRIVSIIYAHCCVYPGDDECDVGVGLENEYWAGAMNFLSSDE
jgi:hypothetical protein